MLNIGTAPRVVKAVCTAALVVLPVVAPLASRAQDSVTDFAHFDCWKIRRDGDVLELDRLTSEGPVATVFSCIGRSCVNQSAIEAKDGTVSRVFRHIYFPRDRNEYVSTWAMWRQGGDTPAIHRSVVYQLVRCTPPDESDQTQPSN